VRDLIILRGLPGSGKSTLASLLASKDASIPVALERLFTGSIVCEADDYMVNSEGRYCFDRKRLKKAHGSCILKCEMLMDCDAPMVIVSNTLTQKWELKAYYKLALKYDYRVFSLIVENRHGGESIHDVYPENLLKMRERFETKL